MYEKFVILKDEVDYLKNKDIVVSDLIDLVGELSREIIPNHFIALVNSIIYQQISFKAGNTIWNRFSDLLGAITPENVINISSEDLRSCGLSKSKTGYVKNVANAIVDGKLNVKELKNQTDEEIVTNLIKIKGIGNWTAEMFLIFSLNRKNVINYDDLAIRKGIQWLYKLKDEPTKSEFEAIRDRFTPYNTILSFYLWEITIQNLFKYKDIYNVTEVTI